MKRLTALLLCILLLCGCTESQSNTPKNFFYPSADPTARESGGVLGSEYRDISPIWNDLGAILELYLKGPEDPRLLAPLPQGAQLLEHSLYEQVLTLRFNKALADLSGIELTVVAGCLARTFLPLAGAHTLILTADGALLNGNTSLNLTMEDLYLRDDSLDRLHAAFTVYYASTDRRYLIGHDVSLLVSAPEELPLHLLELLLTPPEDSGLRSALPDGTRFLDVSIEDGLCTVDVSGEFENRRYSALSAQCLSLLSVVNTLTALDQIDRVEFVVDGSLLIRYGSMPITAPLVRDERCIGPIRTALGEREATLCLAFGNEELLVPIPARFLPSNTMSTPQLVLQALLRDTGTNGIRSCIPPGTAVNSVTVENGTCTVDLSEGYLATPELVTISNRVLAATMCMIDGIERVQILVNGRIPEGFDANLFGILVPEDDWFL